MEQQYLDKLKSNNSNSSTRRYLKGSINEVKSTIRGTQLIIRLIQNAIGNNSDRDYTSYDTPRL